MATVLLNWILPGPVRIWLHRRKLDVQRRLLPFDRVDDFSRLRTVHPYRKNFGWHRGKCIDRFYIEHFLATHRFDIAGRVLEVSDNSYTLQFGDDRVSKSDVLDWTQREGVTIVADLTTGDGIPDGSFDCIICTQTLMFVYDVQAAVQTLHRMLAPGGTLLITLAGISQIVPPPMTGWVDDLWRFTPASARRIFQHVFGLENVSVESYGNVLTATSLLHGLVVDELTEEEFLAQDPNYPVVIAVRATKAPDRVAHRNV